MPNEHVTDKEYEKQLLLFKTCASSINWGPLNSPNDA